MMSKIKDFLSILNVFVIIVLTGFSIFYAVFAYAGYVNVKHKIKRESKKIAVLTGKNIVFKSGCYTCHSFIKGKRYDNVESLAKWGKKGLSVKQTEKAIRSCKVDAYCSQILTDKQVKYVAEYLNSLR